MPQTAADLGAPSALLRELALPATLFSVLMGHARAVAAAGDRLGLVSIGDLPAIVSRHTADSLLFALVRRPAPGERWVDVGSGAGFPGLVLACCFPATDFTLVEPQQRRAGFLEVQVATLGLSNVDVAARRASAIHAQFDVGVARALAEPTAAIAMLSSLTPSGEQIVAIGDAAEVPESAREVVVRRAGIDSPGRFARAGAGGNFFHNHSWQGLEI